MDVLTIEQIQQIIEEKIPRNLVVPEHTMDGHFYRHVPTNNLFASVTTRCAILEAPHLKRHAANMAVQYMLRNLDALARHPANASAVIEYEQTKSRIINGAVLAWQDELNDAGDIGTQGHGIVENYLNDWIRNKQQPKDIRSFIKGEDARLWAIARSAENFCNDFNVIPIVSEKFVCSLKHKYAGTLDSLMMVERVLKPSENSCKLGEHKYYGIGNKLYELECFLCQKKIVLELALVDWKTSNSIDKVEYAMQVSAYWWALFEMTGLRPKHIFIVRLDKDKAKYEVLKVMDRPLAFRAFMHASRMFDWLNDGREKLAPIVAKERIMLNIHKHV